MIGEHYVGWKTVQEVISATAARQFISEFARIETELDRHSIRAGTVKYYSLTKSGWVDLHSSIPTCLSCFINKANSLFLSPLYSITFYPGRWCHMACRNLILKKNNKCHRSYVINHLKDLSCDAALRFLHWGTKWHFILSCASFGENNVSLTKPRGLLRLYLWWQLGPRGPRGGRSSPEDAGKQGC